MSKVVWLILRLISCCYPAIQMILKKNLAPQKIAQNILKLAEEVLDGGERDVLVSGIIKKGDDYNAKVQKVNEFLSEIRTRKKEKYIDNGNIGLDTLNRSKLHLNRFGTIQL